MDARHARPILFRLARILHEHGLEAILVGNAAAALRGATVTTIGFDFHFRKTPRNIAKLKAVTKSLDAVLWKAVYPRSGMYRLTRDRDLLQVNFTPYRQPISRTGLTVAKLADMSIVAPVRGMTGMPEPPKRTARSWKR